MHSLHVCQGKLVLTRWTASPTVHRLTVQLVPSVDIADLVLEFLVWIRDLPDLVLVIDEVPMEGLAVLAVMPSRLLPE